MRTSKTYFDSLNELSRTLADQEFEHWKITGQATMESIPHAATTLSVVYGLCSTDVYNDLKQQVENLFEKLKEDHMWGTI